MKAAKKFVPVFVDTLKDLKTTKRFKENYGSYPVLRIHDLKGRDIAGRIDGNKVAGRIPVAQMLEQFRLGLKKFPRKGSPAKPGGKPDRVGDSARS